MKIIPHTLDSWCELALITTVSYLWLMYTARRYGNRIIYGTCAYVLSIALIYATSLSLLIPLVPYITLLLVFYTLTPTTLPAKNTKKVHAAVATTLDTQSWLVHCLKTIFNHPHAQSTVTLLIANKDELELGIHINAPLNIPWNQALFMSLLYDPQISQGMLWLSQAGSLLGMKAEWVDQEIDVDDSLTRHKKQTAEYSAIICIVDQMNRSCTLIDHGVVQAPKNITETVQYITLLTGHAEHLKEGTYHGARHKQHNTHNHTP